MSYPEAWQPMTPRFSGGSLARSAAITARILDDLNLGDPRYLRDMSGTKCNILVFDACVGHGLVPPRLRLFPGRKLDQNLIKRLQAAGLPQDALDQLLAPRWLELDANGAIVWLERPDFGGVNGWSTCTLDEARLRGNAGMPTVATWFDPKPYKPIGHVAWVIDTPPGEELNICQAGATNFRRGRLSQGFGGLPVRFFTHD